MITCVKREVKYDFIRVFLTILVVIGHSSYYDIKTPFGGLYIQSSMLNCGIEDTIVHSIISNMANIIYAFHMPAFVVLSGVLFKKKLKRVIKVSFKKIFTQKCKLLIFPMIFVWFCWNVPIKFFSGYYENSNVWKMIVQVFFPANVYLWYLEAVFFDFILAYAILKMFNREILAHITVLLLWGVGMLIEINFASMLPVGNPLKWLLWFWIGMYLEKAIIFLKKINIWNSGYCIGMLITWGGVYFSLRIMRITSMYRIMKETLLPLSMVFIIWFLAEYVETKYKNVSTLEKYSSYTFGVYLYAEPLNYLILTGGVEILGINSFGTNGGALLALLLRLFITPVVAIFIVKILRKINFPIKTY